MAIVAIRKRFPCAIDTAPCLPPAASRHLGPSRKPPVGKLVTRWPIAAIFYLRQPSCVTSGLIYLLLIGMTYRRLNRVNVVSGHRPL